MDFVNLLLFCLMSCVIGAVVMLLIQYYAFVRYFRLPELDQEEENQRKSAFSERYVLPDPFLASVIFLFSPIACGMFFLLRKMLRKHIRKIPKTTPIKH